MSVPACKICGSNELPLAIYTDAIQHESGEVEMIRSVRVYLCADCNHDVKKNLAQIGTVEADDLMPHERYSRGADS